MTYWEDIEIKLPEFKIVDDRKILGRSIKIITVVVMGCALRE